MYGLIGEKLGHSFSKEIHEKLGRYAYSLKECNVSELDEFFRAKNFNAVNVTIPYKQTVMPYLAHIDTFAEKIGAVNTVVNKNGELYGYNTDFFGLKSLIERIGVSLQNKKVAILGTGGTSKTAAAVCEHLGAKEIIKVSRREENGAVCYQTLYESHADVEYLINTTPVGMFPSTNACPVEIDKLPCLLGVADVVYNPLQTLLVLQAKARKIPAEGGLYMLVAQAIKAAELFLGEEIPVFQTERIFKEMLFAKRNIVLIGMPSSGKSTVSKMLGERLGRRVLDTDEVIVQTTGRKIPEIFASEGEEKFRELEKQAVESVSSQTGVVIATGGGAILKPENVENLRKNGKIYFLDRPLALLTATADRPLTKDEDGMKKRYDERYEKYLAAADYVLQAVGSLEEETKEILGDFSK